MRTIIKMLILSFFILNTCTTQKSGSKDDYPYQPVPFTSVEFNDNFWSPRHKTNRQVTIPYDFKKCEETGRIDNFAVAGGLKEGEHIGRRYNDSDVFKIVEGAAYSLAIYPDPELDNYLDDLIEKFAAAQEDDGYLYTMRTINPEKVSKGAGERRWSYIAQSHELYNVGHMYEAAVAHYLATGKRNFLDVAIKSADLIEKTFGPGKRMDPPGHQEIEIGLAKLYRITGEEKYLKLAKFFLDQRGNFEGHESYGEYCQDHKQVVEQDEAVGHAVRAGYMYSGMADIAALTGNKTYIRAIDRIWENVVSKKLYMTGGIGSRHSGEAFGDNYELPNLTAYNETCAAIANMMWNHRLFLLHGDAKYMDVLERTLYNGFLSGIAFSGDEFFYPNPLESDGSHKRSPWFDCSCCPSNVVRFLPSLPGYVYAQKNNNIFVNLYISGSAKIQLKNNSVIIKQDTEYPWDEIINIRLEPQKEESFSISIRIPGWTQNSPVPSDLYRYLNNRDESASVKINGEKQDFEIRKGFAEFKRKWKKGDKIEIHFPMRVRRAISHENVKDNEGKAALERGPIVYCAEWPDNNGHVRNLVLPDETKLKTEFRSNMLNGINVITGEVPALFETKSGKTEKKIQKFTAIPYYAWAHRGQGEMMVWFPRNESNGRPLPFPSIASESEASASFTYSGDAVTAMNNQDKPKNSNDHSIPRFTWWNHKGTKEWVQYDLKEEKEISSVEVYWFDDEPIGGGCRIPESWKLLYKNGPVWEPVENLDNYGVDKNKFNKVNFKKIKTDALRIEVQLQENYSGGILEWKVK